MLSFNGMSPAQSRSQKMALFTLFLVVATELIGFGLIVPVLPQIAERFQVGGVAMGVLLAAYSFAQFFAAPFLGNLSDKIGRKPVLVFSKLGSMLAYILMAFSGGYWLFLLARLIDGFTGGNISVARAYVSDVTSAEDRPKGMAIIGIGFATGFILGPALGGKLFSLAEGSYKIPMLIAAGFSGIATLLTIFVLKEPERRQETRSFSKVFSFPFSYLKSRTVQAVILQQLAFMVIFSGFETSFAVFTAETFHFSLHANSKLFFYFGILGLLIQGGITRRPFKNLRAGILLGVLLTAAGFATLANLTTPKMMYVALGLMALGFGLVNTHLPALLSVASNHSAGALMGLYESVGSFSRILGPLLSFVGFYGRIQDGYLIFSIALVASVGLFVSLSVSSRRPSI